jgi:hypothetical protein
MPQKRVSDTIPHVTLTTINGAIMLGIHCKWHLEKQDDTLLLFQDQ